MESKIMDDIGEYKATLLFGMTVRQTVFGIMGVFVVALSYFLSNSMLDPTTSSYIAILLGLPCFLLGFYRPEKMHLEQYILMIFKNNILKTRFRIYKTENIILRLQENIKKV